MACWAYAFGLNFASFKSKLGRNYQCESSTESKLGLFLFLSGLYKRKNLEASDIGRFQAAIVLVNRLITGPINSFYISFQSIIEQQLTSCERVSFQIDNFADFLCHLRKDIETAEKVLYSMIHNNSLLKVLTNPFQFSIQHALTSVSRSSHHRRILKAKRLFKPKVVPVRFDLLVAQSSSLYNLPLEMILEIAKYLSTSDKIALMLTCKKMLFIGRTLFNIRYEQWQDLKSPTCESFKSLTLETEASMSECKCVVCLNICPCERRDFADYIPLKKFLFSNVVFDLLHIQTPQDLTIFSECLRNVPSHTKVNFAINIIDLLKLFTQREFNILEYTVDLNTNLETNEIEIKNFFSFPFVKNLTIAFTGLIEEHFEKAQKQKRIASAIVRGHLQAFLEIYHSQRLDTLQLNNCQSISRIFTPQIFRSDFTWYRSVRIVEFETCKMSCKMLSNLKSMSSLEALFLNNITVEESCAPDHFNRHLRTDFLNLKNSNGLHIPTRFPPVQMFVDATLLCPCPNVDLTPENFEQYRRSTFEISVCLDCTLNFGCGP